MALHNFCSTASIVVFMFCFRTVVSDIVVVPSSREVQRGGSTYFNCSTSVTSKEIHWFHYPTSTTERSFVYGFGQFYSPYLGRFAMDKNATTGEYNLIIKSVVAEDAGKYECQDNAGSGMKKPAHLIVLDTDLMCQSNVNVQKVIGPNSCDIEPDQLILTCMVQYHGNEDPILLWRLDDNNESITNGVTRQVNGNRVVFNLTITTDELSNGSFYVCQTTRSTSKISCNYGNVAVVGSTQGQGASGGDGNCESWKSAFICMCILLILSIGVVVLILMLTYNQRCKHMANNIDSFPCMKNVQTRKTTELTVTEDMNNMENNTMNEPTGTPETDTSDTNQEDTDEPEATVVQAPLLPNPNTSGEQVAKIKSLQTELYTSRKENEKLNSIIQQNDGKNATAVNSLQARIKYLERHLYPKENVDYAGKPSLAHTIRLSGKNEPKPITGMTVLGNELFAVTESSQEIEVYDSKTFQHERNMKITEMKDPVDIASSKAPNCLYIIDRGCDETGCKVTRLDTKGKVLNQWSSDGMIGRLSTYESNVVLCQCDKQVITEYSPKGDIITTVRLSPAAKLGLNHPWHAIKVSGMHFVVSLGEGKDAFHGVCVVDLDGNIATSTQFGQLKILTKMKVPICLAEDNERFIVVADRDNNRSFLLSPHLEYKKNHLEVELQKKDNPVRLCFDDTNSKLFVAVNKSGSGKKDHRILIFNAK